MFDELIKRLRNRRICIQQSGSLDDFPLLKEAADAIEELSKPRWIPVTEQLPKDAGVYLCRIKSFSHEFRYTDTMKYVDGFFYEQGAVTDRVTHWMPLPSTEGLNET